MINSKDDLIRYIDQDAKANGRDSIKEKLIGDSIWKSIVNLRKREYYASITGTKSILFIPFIIFERYKLSKLSIKCGYTLPVGVFEEGLSIAHKGNIVVNSNAKVGKNCRIHEGVTIGATNGSNKAPVIGNNVFIASGAKVIGDIHIADDVAIGANAVVVKDINESGITVGGVPAKKISNNNSHSNLNSRLFNNEERCGDCE